MATEQASAAAAETLIPTLLFVSFRFDRFFSFFNKTIELENVFGCCSVLSIHSLYWVSMVNPKLFATSSEQCDKTAQIEQHLAACEQFLRNATLIAIESN